MKIKIKAFAKINLLLDIVSTRTDGYHDLFMIMQSVGIYDTVTVSSNKSNKILITSNIDDIPLDSGNIVYKASQAFFKATGLSNPGLNIDLCKKIPHGAGLAGGSADAAAVLIALNEIFNTNLNEDELCKIGVKIGADVPFCIKGGTLLAQGIGDVLNKVKPLRQCYILLAKPDYQVNTGEAYSNFDNYGKTHTPDKLGMLCAMQSRNLIDISAKMENVFEQFIEVPNRVDIKSILRQNNSLGTCMSGSGPTIFGIFDNEIDANNAAEELKNLAKDIFICKPVSKGCKIIEKSE